MNVWPILLTENAKIQYKEDMYTGDIYLLKNGKSYVVIYGSKYLIDPLASSSSSYYHFKLDEDGPIRYEESKDNG